MNSSNRILRPQPTLLGVPSEVRFMIYKYLTEFTGVITIFSRYDIASEVDRQTIDLLHVCSVIRREVQDAFYKNQTFGFRSYQAIRIFCKSVSPYHLSIIRNIELGTQLSRRRIDFFKLEVCDILQRHLTGVERLTIHDPNLSYLTRFVSTVGVDDYDQGYKHRASAKVHALRAISANLASANLYYRYEINDLHLYQHRNNLDNQVLSSKLLFVPWTCTFPRKVRGPFRQFHWVRFQDLTCYDLVDQ